LGINTAIDVRALAALILCAVVDIEIDSRANGRRFQNRFLRVVVESIFDQQS
jgi:hypothetical protein